MKEAEERAQQDEAMEPQDANKPSERPDPSDGYLEGEGPEPADGVAGGADQGAQSPSLQNGKKVNWQEMSNHRSYRHILGDRRRFTHNEPSM